MKIKNVAALTKKLMMNGAYAISKHAKLRQGERLLSLGDVKNIIKTGYHEVRKDEYKKEFQDWNYAIRGQTLDGGSKSLYCLLRRKSFYRHHCNSFGGLG